LKRLVNSFLNIDNWLNFWKFYYSNKNGKYFQAQFRNGLIAEVHPELIPVFDEIFLRDIYNFNIKKITDSPTIIDIGANIGYFSIYISSKLPKAKIIAFEPVPSNYKLLQHHKTINNLDSLTLDNRAVMGDKASIELGYNDSIKFQIGASMLSREMFTKSIQVEAISIPDIFKEYKIDHLDLLKIDCEGAEYNILFNCPKQYYQKIKKIAIEVHSWVPETEGSIKKLTDFLRGHGFKVKNKKDVILLCWNQCDTSKTSCFIIVGANKSLVQINI
jgi:FkbM family methyltransferase